ncbi:hypothetical protein TRP66_11360 [Pseudomonas sp. JDS28PS106]|uniref:hypothetical protein n=1 Tax=Pseudomonas sp. JDS28PS106 TaxID=2497235 RepID=UPI002FD2007A
MNTLIEGIYSNSLVAVFEAAFRLGYDPYALAAQAKIDVAKLLKLSPLISSDGPRRVIDESLLVARIVNERWQLHDSDLPSHQDDEPKCRP